MKTTTINGVDFEVINNRKNDISAIEWYENHYKGMTIWDCYSRPSHTKVSIYDWWWKFAVIELGLYNFHVCSYNCNFFSLYFEGYYHDEDGKRHFGRFYITHAHNRVALD